MSALYMLTLIFKASNMTLCRRVEKEVQLDSSSEARKEQRP